jgi:hypothetical protein
MRATRGIAAVLGAFLAVLGAASAGAGAAGSSTPECAAGATAAYFRVVPGSAGAGSISYDLQLRNTSARRCYATTVGGLRLLSKTGSPLPTKVMRTTPKLTGVHVSLAPGAWAAATARFSPDIPGPGEPQTSQCEPTSHRLKVTLHNGGTVTGPVSPPTPVCEHGTMALTGLVAGKHGPRS